jgi:peptidyl-prolyl cis-trans isomerase SurA
VLILVAALVPVAACKKQTAPAPDVWAVVNGKEIRRDEVEKYFRSRIGPEGQPLSHEESLTLMLNVVDELVSNEILLARAQTLGLVASDGEVEDKFTEFKAPFTEDEFQRQLKDRGLSIEDLKRDLRRQLSVQKLLNREVVSKISITDQDLLDFYNQNRAQFNVVEPQYRVAQIVITPRRNPQVRNRKASDASTDTEARRIAQALYERLREGADFGELAMDYSEDPTTASTGGDLGFIPESSLKQTDVALQRAVLALKPGEFSPIITLPDGLRIVKLIARESAGQREFSDVNVQETIRNILRNRKEQLLRSAYLSSARDAAQVQNFLSRQVLESAGKLPEVKLPTPAKAAAPAATPAQPAKR